MAAFEIPEKCRPHCPFVSVDLERYNIQPTKNCKGIKSDNGPLDGKIFIYVDGYAETTEPPFVEIKTLDNGDLSVTRTYGELAGDLVCRNVGINISIDNLLLNGRAK